MAAAAAGRSVSCGARRSSARPRCGHSRRSGQASFSGLYYAATMDAHVGFESWLERDVAMMLDFDQGVVAFSSQPFWLTWPEDCRQRRHAPDYFAAFSTVSVGTTR